MKIFKKITIYLIVLILMISSVYTCYADSYFMEDGFKYSVSNGYATIVGYEGTDNVVEIPLDFNGFVVNTIDMAAFSGNDNITEIKLPYLLRYINSSAFANMKSLKSINIPELCEQMGSHTFDGCEGLSDVLMETASLKTITERAFYNCVSLESFVVPYGTESIKDFAFENCTSLKYITIPNTVTEISDSAFSGVDNLCIICSEGSQAEEYAELWGADCYHIGDSNADGKVNILDVTAIQKYKIGEQELSEYGMRCADVNHDGSITVRDATLIQMKLAKYDVDF